MSYIFQIFSMKYNFFLYKVSKDLKTSLSSKLKYSSILRESLAMVFARNSLVHNPIAVTQLNIHYHYSPMFIITSIQGSLTL